MAKDIKRAEYFLTYKDILTKKQQETMEMYYISDLSLSEISRELNITRQGVFNCITNSEEKLDELENAIGLMKKREKLEEALLELEGFIRDDNKSKALDVLEKIREIY